MTLAQRIKKARLAVGMSQQALADALSQFGDRRSVSRTTITQWETGNTREIEAGNLLKAAKALNVAAEWLQFGTGDITPLSLRLDGLATIVCNARAVPILDHTEVSGKGKMKVMEYNDGLTHVGIDALLADATSTQAFALEVQEDSMSPAFKAGDIVIIDPSITPKPGEVVLVKLDNPQTIVLRKYRPLNGQHNETHFELISFNEDWPKIIVNEKNVGRIIGTLIEHRCQRRLKPASSV